MRQILLPALLLLLTVPIARADTEVRTYSESFPADALGSLEIGTSVGQLLIEGADSDVVEVTMSVSCEDATPRCRDRAKKIALEETHRDGELVLGVAGITRRAPTGIRVKLRLVVPRALDLEVGLGVGDVHVRDTAGDVEIDVGVGDVEVEIDRKTVRRIELDTGVGKALLRTDLGETVGSGIVGSRLEWRQDTGEAEIEVDTGVGEIGVRLR